MQQRSLERCLGGRLDDLFLLQASLGVCESGLGLRRAANIMLPAFVASVVENKWIVGHLAREISAFVSTKRLLFPLDAKLTHARADFESRLSPAGSAQARILVDQAELQRASPDAALHCGRRRRETALRGDGLILPAGAEDNEAEPDNLQSELCAFVDSRASLRLLEDLDTPELQPRRRRLLELRSASWPGCGPLFLVCAARSHARALPRPRQYFSHVSRVRWSDSLCSFALFSGHLSPLDSIWA